MEKFRTIPDNDIDMGTPPGLPSLSLGTGSDALPKYAETYFPFQNILGGFGEGREGQGWANER
jgi:hypothetical protein